MHALVLHSGGLDSTVALAQAIQDGAQEITSLSCHYGSKHNERELRAASEVCAWYSNRVTIKHIVQQLPDIFRGADSALMGEIDMPHLTYEQIAGSVGPSPTVVPFRNANLLSVATTIAITRGAEYVYAGMHAEDARNWAYPDCTPEFLGAMANAIYVGTYNAVRLMFPLIWMLKADVVKRGVELEIPFVLTYSCYEGGEDHCGECPTCIERKQAFDANGFWDPTIYYRGRHG